MARSILLSLLAASCIPTEVYASTNITVALVSNHNAPWIYSFPTMNGGLQYSGIIVDLLNYIQQLSALPCVNTQDLSCGLNFQFQLFDNWGVALESFFNGTTAIVPSLPVTNDLYNQGISFTGAWSQSDLAFVTLRTRDEKGLLYIVSPLTGTTWAVTLAGFALAALSMAVVSRCRPPNPEGCPEDGEKLNLRDSIFRSTLALTGLATVPPNKHSQRLIHLSAFLLFFFVIRAYLARLTALAAVPAYSITIDSWADLTSLPAGNGQQVGIVAGSAAETWINASTSPKIRAVLPYLKQYPNQEAAIADLRAKAIPAMVSESCTARFLALVPPCTPDLRIVPVIDSSVNIGDVAMGYLTKQGFNQHLQAKGLPPNAFPANESYAPQFVSQSAVDTINYGIAKLVETGQFTAIENSYVYSAGNCESLDGASTIEANAVTPQDLSGAMALFGICVAFAVTLVISERRRASKLKVNGGWREVGDVAALGPLALIYDLLNCCERRTAASTLHAGGPSDSPAGGVYAGLSSPRPPLPSSEGSSGGIVTGYRAAAASLTRGNSLRAAGMAGAK